MANITIDRITSTVTNLADNSLFVVYDRYENNDQTGQMPASILKTYLGTDALQNTIDQLESRIATLEDRVNSYHPQSQQPVEP